MVSFYREDTMARHFGSQRCSDRKESWCERSRLAPYLQRLVFALYNVFSVDPVRSVSNIGELLSSWGFPSGYPNTISFYVVWLSLFPPSGYF